MPWLPALWHRQWSAPEVGPHTTFYCAIGLRTPHTLPILRSWFLLPTGVCRPTSTDSFPCALSPSHFRPGGATSSGVGVCPHPPVPAVDCSADLSACLCRAPSPPRPFSPASDCWRCRPRVLALIVLLAPGCSACSAGVEFSRGTALRYLWPLSARSWLFPRGGGSAGAHCH